jgi:DNA-binding transcriptional regulator YiaG
VPVYFVQSGSDGPIKIGFTVNIANRLYKMKTDCPDLRLIAMAHGTMKTEKALHKKFAAHRISGEWFSPDNILITEIAELSDPALIPQNMRGSNKIVIRHGGGMTGPQFAAAIAALGYSQNKFALKAGVEQGTVSKWCRAETVPRYAEVIVKLLHENRELRDRAA